MIRIRFDRLQELADHLLHGELIHEKFDFETYNSSDTYDEEGNQVFNHHPTIKNCGSAGCALGELPRLNPDWYFAKNGVLMYIADGVEYFDAEGAVVYFGITEEQEQHLFWPNMQVPEFGYNVGRLDSFATKEEVAHNILDFIAYHRNLSE